VKDVLLIIFAHLQISQVVFQLSFYG